MWHQLAHQILPSALTAALPCRGTVFGILCPPSGRSLEHSLTEKATQASWVGTGKGMEAHNASALAVWSRMLKAIRLFSYVLHAHLELNATHASRAPSTTPYAFNTWCYSPIPRLCCPTCSKASWRAHEENGQGLHSRCQHTNIF